MVEERANPGGDAFPFEWEDPADAERTWILDREHTPDPVTPLSFDLYWQPFMLGFGLPSVRQINYYSYLGIGAGAPAPPEGWVANVDFDRLARHADRFRDDIVPEVVSLTEPYLHTDFDALDDAALVEELERLPGLRRRLGELHTAALRPWSMAMQALIEVFKEITGGSDVDAMRLVQGHGNRSIDAGRALWRLGRLAADTPSVREAIESTDAVATADALATLRADAGAATFVEQFDAFLDEFGWRSDLFEFAQPTWVEDPAIPLAQIRRFMEMDGYDHDAEQHRLGQERDEALARALDGLEPAQRERLSAAVETGGRVVNIQEDHNFYIDQRAAFAPRRLVLAAGRRLVEKGTIDDPADVFYLRAAELGAALRADVDDARPLIASRKQDMARWAQASPPPVLGSAPSEVLNRMRSATSDDEVRAGGDRKRDLSGIGVSGGTVTGPARVLLALSEADRLGEGDVLVARTTMPAWTPLFAVAAAIVTETGGVLSHAAVVAREYRLPAVLGVAGATRLIRDGDLVEVDGREGTVRLLV